MTKENFILLFIILLTGVSFAQDSIHGKIYGDREIAKYIKVSNIIRNTTTFSDEKGNFNLKASIGDSIIFSSSFYEKKKIVIDKTHFTEILIIQLKDKINQLEEVILNQGFLEKDFNNETQTKELTVLIKNDVVKNPWEYEVPPPSRQGINLKGFLYLKKLLFPEKDKKGEKNITYEPISYEDLKKLNRDDTFFNDMFFTKDLKIPGDLKYIFFEYFDDQKISSELLSGEKRLLLIQKFFEVSNAFLSIVNQIKY